MTAKNSYLPSHIVSLSALLLMCSSALLAQAPPFTSFDAPDAGSGWFQGTKPTAISATGLIAGSYSDSTSHAHGFLRRNNRQITEFDVSGIFEPSVLGVNALGQIIGYGTGPDALTHGFLRNADGRFLHLDPPNSVLTIPTGINDHGDITGFYEDRALMAHGFVRNANGTFTVIDDPDAFQGSHVGTTCDAINASGVTTGTYLDKNTGKSRAFVRDAAGNFTNFDPAEGSVAVYQLSVNSSGQIAGYYYTSGSSPAHSFLRDSSEDVTVFDMVGATNTSAMNINDSGAIVGQWDRGGAKVEGFRRNASGNFTNISIPNNRGTTALAINNKGKITGSYLDANSTYHGFVE